MLFLFFTCHFKMASYEVFQESYKQTNPYGVVPNFIVRKKSNFKEEK